MKTIKLELDFLIGPIIKDIFSVSQNKLITGVDSIDNNKSINELNDKISSLYSSFYDFDSGDESCRFNIESAKEHKDELLRLIDDLLLMLQDSNDGSFEIVNNINLDW